MMKKVTSDLVPCALNCPMLPSQKDKWMVFFVLNDVEFTTGPCYTEEEAKEICQRVYERVTEWAAGGHVWVKEDVDECENDLQSRS